MIQLTDKPIDVGAVMAAVDGPGAGAVTLFVGRVREQSRERDVERLDYEAYGDMAISEMQALAEEACREHGALRVAMVHREGRLALGETAVAFAVAAAHRPEAFEACRWLIDTLKERVPIWKKERYSDGEEWISQNP